MKGTPTLPARRAAAVLTAVLAAACADPDIASVEVDVASVDVLAPTSVLAVGAAAELRSVVLLGPTGPEDPDFPVRWSSSDPSVLRVDGAGRVTGVSPGSAVVRARAGSEEAGIRLEVVPPYTVDAIGDPGTEAIALNDRGWVAGVHTFPDGSRQAFLWDGATPTPLGEWRPADLDDEGAIVGFRPGPVAVRWRDGVLSEREPSVPAGAATMADRIGPDGSVVGRWIGGMPYCAPGCQGGYFVHAEGRTTLLPGTVVNPRAAAVNSLGWVAGGGGRSRRCPEEPVVYREGAAEWLQPEGAVAVDVNDAGTVLGDTGCGGGASWLWRDGGDPVRLAAPASVTARIDRAAALSAAGEVVGTAVDPGFTGYGVLWRPDALVVLDRLVPGDHDPIVGASRINERGQILAESMDPATNERRAVLLTPAP